MGYIFVSYSHDDSDYVKRLVDKLESEGFEVWYDGRTRYGDEWWDEIVKAINGCSAFIIVMTPASGQSRWVKREVMLADNLNIPIFPLLLEGDLHSAPLWSLFLSTLYTDVREKTLPPVSLYTALAGHAMRSKRESPLVNQPNQSVRPAPPNVSLILPPPFEWCYVPGGKVTIEYVERKSGGYNVATRRDFDVPAFHISKYPITNAQYQAFVTSGYREMHWWDFSNEAKVWWTQNRQPARSAFGGKECPRTDVTWYEAVAFCRWLDAQVGQTDPLQISLPTEQQWQRAAQGDDGRPFPWGYDFDGNRCNTWEGGLGRTTPVTQFPAGASPFQVHDLSGNVWEWCKTTGLGNIVDLKGRQMRVVRGGSWKYVGANARLEFRAARDPDLRDHSVGFRCVYSVQ
jgi:formylglycine-generating enzyme required for sulfatase activity